MRAPLLALALVSLLLGACVDGVTPDCSKVNCGTPTSDAAPVVDAASEASADASADATSSDAGASDAKADGSVDAKTD